MRINYRSLCVSVTLIMLASVVAFAQKSVTGTVKDPAGIALPGVNILIKGTNTGTTTDANGNFAINASAEDVLVISFIGYKTEELTVGDKTTLDVTMAEDLTTLGEVVVVGYGVQKKALNTGANLQVKGEDLQKLSTTNALQALQGQAAGVQITSTSGQPGEGMKVTIRGLGTIGSAQPLYVVDGVLTGDISFLNPADIQSIDVLKDAASAAIYGSQAANGVVLVTTRTGKANTKAQFTFDGFYGVQNPARVADMLNAREYATIMNEAAVNSGKLPYFTNAEIAALDSGTNWMDEMFVRNAATQSYTIGASGGSEATVYSASLGYISQEGIVGGKNLSNYERYNFRINTEHKLYKDVLTIGQHLTFAYVENRGIGVGNQYNNTLRGAFNTSPFVPMYDSEGEFWDNSNSTWHNGEANPYALMVLNNQNERNNQKLLGDFYITVEPVKNLKFRTSLGIDYYANESHSFSPIYKLSIYAFNNESRVNQSMGKGRTLLWDNLVSYGLDLAGQHSFDVMVGSSAFQYNGTYLWGNNRNLVFNDLDHSWLDNATNTAGGGLMSTGGGPEAEDKRMSYFARLNYNFSETFLFNATFRADGSSRFAKGNRWGYFPSLSAGWVMSNQGFLESAGWLDFLKLRASWGQVGNLNVGAFQYLAPISFANTNYSFGPEEGVLTPGAFPSRLGNPNLKWETSEQTNVGIDARFLAGKMNVNLDWYIKTTKDWLIAAPILATAGADAPFINGGDVKNTGIELMLSYSNSVGELQYTLSANGAYNKNTVGSIPNVDGIVHGLSNQLFDNSLEFNRAQNGLPIGYFWGLQTAGIFQTEEEVAAHRSSEGDLIQPNALPGDVRYVDRNNDGQINDLDRTIIGDPNPDYTFGFSASANYKGFDLSIVANGVAGNQLVQSYRNHANQYANYTTAILDRWHGPGSSNTMPRITENSSNWLNFSDLYIHDGDFLRISNVTLGYDLSKLLKGKSMNQFRIYASALNLLTLTKYEGMDPEVGYGVNSFSSGIDLGYYPRPRTYMIGMNLKF
ncbi:MAG TPA: TonB-dependent receptor [Chryseosolibacter sp.]|nr:TonB-dependent receptor [Chryseosolibacter sp.]